ncbi:MAG: helix-turn-helix domain-containing protein [Deltaproteobacteria bacterium]|nr:helix-turn-helix domain-containing protein [Deltaproteobacteria bacterium]
MANKAFVFRIYPTRKQEDLMNRTFGCCRFVWNRMP